MKIIAVIIISVLTNQFLPAQSKFDIFKLDIPYNILNNKNQYDQMGVSFDYYSDIDPSLIAYYLNYLNRRYLNSITNPDSNGYNLLQSKTRQLIIRRNDWVQQELNDAWENIPTVILAFKVRSFLDYSAVDETQPLALENKKDFIGKNYIDFCILKYFSSDPSLKYSEDIVYGVLIPEAVKKIQDNFYLKFKDISNLSRSERFAIADSVHSYFLFFDKGYGNDLYPKMNIRAYEFLNSLFEEEFNQSFSVGFVYGQSEFAQTTTHSFNFTEQLSDLVSVNFSGDFENKFMYSKYIGLLLKLKIREKIRPYSYVSIGFSKYLDNKVLSATSSVPESAAQYYVIRPDTGIYGYRIDSYYEFRKLSDPSITTYSFQLNIPVFYAFRKLFLEAGLDYTYFNSKFKYSLSRKDEFFIPNVLDPSYLVNYTHTYEYETTRHIFYPTISINYEPWDYITIRSKFRTKIDKLNFEIFLHL
ncbi:MAG: hypothetical protein IPM56_08125 [Ignavibacteriales bacterium]|nr:MAG: hypothetical protein IPM56_08125 [Ignavibacteriales bacterium]